MSTVCRYCRHNILISLGNNYLLIELNVCVVINLNLHNTKCALCISFWLHNFWCTNRTLTVRREQLLYISTLKKNLRYSMCIFLLSLRVLPSTVDSHFGLEKQTAFSHHDLWLFVGFSQSEHNPQIAENIFISSSSWKQLLAL